MRAEELSICLLYMRRRALGRDWYEHKCEHGCARVVYSLEPISLIFSTGAVKAAPTAPPNKTPQIRQTTDDDDFVLEIIGGAIVLGMIFMIYARHSCYLRFCRNRQDNAGAILNLPNMVQLPSYFLIGPPYLHKDDGITLVNQDWTTLFSVRGNAIKKRRKEKGLARPPMSNVRAFASVCFFVLFTDISFTDD